MRADCRRLAVFAVMLALPPLARAQSPEPTPAPPAAGQPAAAPAAAPSAEDLAKQLSNPVASLVSVPFQFNWDQPVGPDDDTLFLLPTNSNAVLGSSKWAAGPTVVVLKQSGGWTYGMLANHLWSFAGDDRTSGSERAELSVSFLQPFVSYTTKSAWTIAVNAEASGSWRLYEPGAGGTLEEAEGTDWTVPVNLVVTKLTKFGPLPMSVGAGVGVFVETPDGRPDWRLRLVGTILLPRK